MQEVKIQSPTRVDLAGGTLDLWPLYNFVGGATTVNVAIDILSTVQIKKRNDKKISIDSRDLHFYQQFDDLTEVLLSKNSKLKLFKPLFQHLQPSFGFDLVSSSQSPVGGGLGGSSSLMISHLKAFHKLMQKTQPSCNELVQVAHNLEAQVLNTPTGTQDYFPAVHGGVNIIHYKADGWICETLQIDDQEFFDRFMLVYTGKSHHSGLNNFQVLTAAVNKNKKVLKALEKLQIVSEQMATAVRLKKWGSFTKIFKQELQFRLQLAPSFSSPEIKKLSKLALKAGVDAVKICGAGGGGCVLLWVSPKKQKEVALQCQKQGFQVLAAKPVNPFHRAL